MPEELPKPIEKERVVYQGNILEIIQQKFQVGEQEITYELARRSPGTRLIILSPDNKLLITREYRKELGTWDYRLPGGKVFDTLSEYNQALQNKEDITAKAEQAAIKEAREEVGIDVERIRHFATSKCGASVSWDLFYFLVEQYQPIQDGQSLEHGEYIEVLTIDLDQAKQICLEGKMQEDRSVAVLLRFLYENGKI